MICRVNAEYRLWRVERMIIVGVAAVRIYVPAFKPNGAFKCGVAMMEKVRFVDSELSECDKRA